MNKKLLLAMIVVCAPVIVSAQGRVVKAGAGAVTKKLPSAVVGKNIVGKTALPQTVLPKAAKSAVVSPMINKSVMGVLPAAATTKHTGYTGYKTGFVNPSVPGFTPITSLAPRGVPAPAGGSAKSYAASSAAASVPTASATPVAASLPGTTGAQVTATLNRTAQRMTLSQAPKKGNLLRRIVNNLKQEMKNKAGAYEGVDDFYDVMMKPSNIPNYDYSAEVFENDARGDATPLTNMIWTPKLKGHQLRDYQRVRAHNMYAEKLRIHEYKLQDPMARLAELDDPAREYRVIGMSEEELAAERIKVADGAKSYWLDSMEDITGLIGLGDEESTQKALEFVKNVRSGVYDGINYRENTDKVAIRLLIAKGDYKSVQELMDYRRATENWDEMAPQGVTPGTSINAYLNLYDTTVKQYSEVTEIPAEIRENLNFPEVLTTLPYEESMGYIASPLADKLANVSKVRPLKGIGSLSTQNSVWFNREYLK